MKIYCIIPAYNEENSIVDVIKSVRPFADKIVVVDDGSLDNTYALAKNQGIHVIRHIINRGQGAALETGNAYARGQGADIVVHFDADGQFKAEEIKDITEPIIKGRADAVFGSRFLSKKSDIPGLKRYMIFPLAKAVNYIFFNVKFTDPQSGFRALSKRANENISIENDGMAHCSEILHKVIKRGYRFEEAPITVIYYNFGQRFSSGLKIIKELFFNSLLN